MTWKTSLLILFAIVMVAFVPLSAYAAVDDGNLRKITSDGQYDIGMSWQPAGPLQPGIDYQFNFEIREGMSQKNIDDASFNFDIVKDGIVTDSTSSTTGTLTKTISFEEPGLVNLLLTDVNSSTQQIDFTFPDQTIFTILKLLPLVSLKSYFILNSVNDLICLFAVISLPKSIGM